MLSWSWRSINCYRCILLVFYITLPKLCIFIFLLCIAYLWTVGCMQSFTVHCIQSPVNLSFLRPTAELYSTLFWSTINRCEISSGYRGRVLQKKTAMLANAPFCTVWFNNYYYICIWIFLRRCTVHLDTIKFFIYQLMHNSVALKECICSRTTEPTTTMYFNWLF